MSYILAALEKADKERRKKRGLTLEGLGDPSPESSLSAKASTGSKKGWWGLLACLIAGGALWQFSPAFLVPEEEGATVPPSPVEAQSLELPTPVETAGIPLPNALPDQVAVEGIVYIEGQPSRSRVFIGGRGYRENDIFLGDVRIMRIEETAITLSNGDASRAYPIP